MRTNEWRERCWAAIDGRVFEIANNWIGPFDQIVADVMAVVNEVREAEIGG